MRRNRVVVRLLLSDGVYDVTAGAGRLFFRKWVPDDRGGLADDGQREVRRRGPGEDCLCEFVCGCPGWSAGDPRGCRHCRMAAALLRMLLKGLGAVVADASKV